MITKLTSSLEDYFNDITTSEKFGILFNVLKERKLKFCCLSVRFIFDAALSYRIKFINKMTVIDN